MGAVLTWKKKVRVETGACDVRLTEKVFRGAPKQHVIKTSFHSHNVANIFAYSKSHVIMHLKGIPSTSPFSHFVIYRLYSILTSFLKILHSTTPLWQCGNLSWDFCTFMKNRKPRNQIYENILRLCLNLFGSTLGSNYSLKSLWL